MAYGVRRQCVMRISGKFGDSKLTWNWTIRGIMLLWAGLIWHNMAVAIPPRWEGVMFVLYYDDEYIGEGEILPQ